MGKTKRKTKPKHTTNKQKRHGNHWICMPQTEKKKPILECIGGIDGQDPTPWTPLKLKWLAKKRQRKELEYN